MKDQTQKIYMKTSSRKNSLQGTCSPYNTLNKYDQNLQCQTSESSGEEFLGFLNGYIQQLKQSSSRGKSVTSQLDTIIQSIEDQRVINRKLAKKIDIIQDILSKRVCKLDKLQMKVDKLRGKENRKQNQPLQKNKDSDFVKRSKLPYRFQESEIECSSKQHTQNDVIHQRRKSAAVPRNYASKALISEQIQNLISQTVGLKNKKYHIY